MTCLPQNSVLSCTCTALYTVHIVSCTKNNYGVIIDMSQQMKTDNSYHNMLEDVAGKYYQLASSKHGLLARYKTVSLPALQSIFGWCDKHLINPL